MPRIEWNSTFSMDNEGIDQQHKQWIETINNLHDTLIKPGNIEILRSALVALKSMRDYTRMHFFYEEKYLRNIRYPDLQAHKVMHDKFYVRIMNYYNDLQEGKMVLNTEVMSTLMRWLQDHILYEDKKYAQFEAQTKKP